MCVNTFCIEIDRAVRRCAWVQAASKKGMHLLKWETLCKPKKPGGATLKMARDMNHALLAKLAWRAPTCKGYTWSEALRTKYGVAVEDGVHFKVKHNASQIWKRVLLGAALMRKGLRWEVRDEGCVQFWRDTWLEHNLLGEMTSSPIPEDQMGCKGIQFWERGIDLRWDVISQHLSNSSMVKLATVLRPDELMLDKFVWLDGWRPSP